MTDRISGSAFKQMIAFGAACVAQQKQAINDLNVFPVPDGDTGTNMSLTIQTAVNELKKSEPATVGEAAKITAGALLRGARGNSGVILSLLLYMLPFGYVVVWCLRRRELLRECPEGAAVVCGLCTFWIVTWFNPWMNAVLGIAWYAVTLSVPTALEEHSI